MQASAYFSPFSQWTCARFWICSPQAQSSIPLRKAAFESLFLLAFGTRSCWQLGFWQSLFRTAWVEMIWNSFILHWSYQRTEQTRQPMLDCSGIGRAVSTRSRLVRDVLLRLPIRCLFWMKVVTPSSDDVPHCLALDTCSGCDLPLGHAAVWSTIYLPCYRVGNTFSLRCHLISKSQFEIFTSLPVFILCPYVSGSSYACRQALIFEIKTP